MVQSGECIEPYERQIMLFWLKILISSFIIAGASHLAGKKPVLAGFIVALPLTSMLALTWAYIEHRDMNKINEFAVSILAAVPLSLFFFVPFILSRWTKLNYAWTFLAGIFCLALAYGFCYKYFRISS